MAETISLNLRTSHAGASVNSHNMIDCTRTAYNNKRAVAGLAFLKLFERQEVGLYTS